MNLRVWIIKVDIIYWVPLPYKWLGMSWNNFLQLISFLSFSSLPVTYSLALSIWISRSLHIYNLSWYLFVNTFLQMYVYVFLEFWDFSCNPMCFNYGVFKLTYLVQCQPENSRDTFFWERWPTITVWWQLLLKLLQYVIIFFNLF